MDRAENIRLLKEKAQEPKEKKVYRIPKVSKKRQEKTVTTELGSFFREQRKYMTGICQCGCGEPSQKKDDLYFSYCICHIFPKSIFPSIATHELNWVERKFFGGCHTNMDERSIERWVNFADWDDIKEKFAVLKNLITDEERATKFYSNLEKLVLAN